MAAVGDVPDVTRKKYRLARGIDFLLGATFLRQKVSSKLKNDAFYGILCLQIKNLSRSDPERRPRIHPA